MNVLLVSAALLFSQPAQQPDLSKKVTFQSVAMPAKKLVSELGKQVGVTLDCSQQTANEVLLVRVTDVPAQTVLNRIAQAVDGEWKQEEGLMRLVRPASNLNRELAAERADRIQAVQKEIKSQIEELNKKPPKEGDPPLPPQLAFTMGQHSKEIIQLVTRISAADLVLPNSDSRAVFSSNPTRTQKLLPGNLEPIVASLVAEHNKAAVRSQEDKHEAQTEEEQRWIDMLKGFGYGQDVKPIEGRPAKLLLIIEQPNFMAGQTATLRLYDSKGQVALEQGSGLGSSRFMDEAMEMGKPKPAPAGEDKPIEFSPETIELNGLFSGMMTMQLRSKISPELDAKLSRPDLYDPLSFGLTESFLTVSKVQNVNLVANLPDATTSLIGLFSGAKPTVNSFLQNLQNMDSVKIDKPEGWMVVTPKWPDEARRNRTDRLGLAKLIGAVKAAGSASLDDLAAFAQTSPSPMEDSASMTYIMLFAPSTMQGMNGLVDWNALRFYGSLDVNQRQSLNSGGRIPFANMTPRQKLLAERILFGPQAGLKVQDPSTKPKEDRGFMEMVGAFMPGQHKDYRQEPTEVMPNGIPPNGYLSGEIAKEPVGTAVGAGRMFEHAAIGADELAMFKFMKDDPNFAMVGAMMPTISQLRMGERTTVTMKFFVAPNVCADKELQDNRVPMNGPVVSMDSLPADFQAKIDRRYAAFKKQPLPGFGFGGPGKIPPR